MEQLEHELAHKWDAKEACGGFLYLLSHNTDLNEYFFKNVCLLSSTLKVCRRGEIDYQLVHSPNIHNSQGWTKPKPVAGNSIWVSHMGGGYPSS